MRMRKLVALLLLSSQLLAEFTAKEARNEPFIIRFEPETQYKLEPFLKKAMLNADWKRANEMMYHETVKSDWGDQSLETANIEGAVEAFIRAGENGIVLASWQGLNIAKALAPMKGKWYERVVPILAKQLVDADICQGYLDLATSKARGWSGSRTDFKEAALTLEKGKTACSRPDGPAWHKDRWAKEFYKYDALTRYPGVLRYTGEK